MNLLFGTHSFHAKFILQELSGVKKEVYIKRIYFMQTSLIIENIKINPVRLLTHISNIK